MAVAHISAERLREFLEYDPTSGLFIWRITRGSRAKAGDVAGNRHSSGYIVINTDGRLYYGHRLAWLYVYGAWPTNQIDHCDGNRANNRFSNLREATNAENAQNMRKAHSDNLSGLLGASRNKRDGKWKAKIWFDRTSRYIGIFATAEEAHAAYLAEKSKVHPFSRPIDDSANR